MPQSNIYPLDLSAHEVELNRVAARMVWADGAPTTEQERDPDTGMPLWAVDVTVYAPGETGGQDLRVVVASPTEPVPPVGSRHPLVTLEGLRVRLWGSGRRTGYSLRADGVEFGGE